MQFLYYPKSQHTEGSPTQYCLKRMPVAQDIIPIMEKSDCMKKKLNSIYTAKKIIIRANTVDRKVGKPLPVT